MDVSNYRNQSENEKNKTLSQTNQILNNNTQQPQMFPLNAITKLPSHSHPYSHITTHPQTPTQNQQHKLVNNRQEQLITIQNRTYIKNKITQEIYEMYKIKDQDIEKYRDRIQLQIPHTPKLISRQPNIILLQTKLHNQTTTKTSQIYSTATINKNQNNSILFSLINTVDILSKKYGYFVINKNMIRGYGNYITIWIHQDYLSNQPQFPIMGEFDGENVMYVSLLQTLKHKFPKLAIIKQILSQHKHNPTSPIKQTLSQPLPQPPIPIPSFLKHQKIEIKQYESIIIPIQDATQDNKSMISTSIDEGSLVARLKKLGKLENLNQKLGLVQRKTYQSVVLFDGEEFWDNQLQKEFNQILGN